MDVIHTSGGSTGIYNSAGHADFFPNGGSVPQPGCYDGMNFERIFGLGEYQHIFIPIIDKLSKLLPIVFFFLLRIFIFLSLLYIFFSIRFNCQVLFVNTFRLRVS